MIVITCHHKSATTASMMPMCLDSQARSSCSEYRASAGGRRSGERLRKVRRLDVAIGRTLRGASTQIGAEEKTTELCNTHCSASGNGEHVCVQLIERRRFATTPFSKLGAISGRITETRERETNEGDRPKIGAYWLASPRGCTALSFQPTSITTGPFQTQR